MTGTALILAGHGSRDDSAANALAVGYAERLSTLGLFDEVTAAFYYGAPTFAEVLDGLIADEITVVPLMTSRGYYSEVVLPRELARSRRFSSVRVRLTHPVGTHPEMVSLVERRVRRQMARLHLASGETDMVLVGHGTARHEHSRDATLALTDSLKQSGICRDVLPAFLDDNPLVETALSRSRQPNVIVEPFLIGGGQHAGRDVPTRIGLDVAEGAEPPYVGNVSGTYVICNGATGMDDGILDLIADLAAGRTMVETLSQGGLSGGVPLEAML